MSIGTCTVCRTPLPAPKAGQRRLYCSPGCRRRVEFARRKLPKLAFARDQLLRQAGRVEATYQAARRGHRWSPVSATAAARFRQRADEVAADVRRLEAMLPMGNSPANETAS